MRRRIGAVVFLVAMVGILAVTRQVRAQESHRSLAILVVGDQRAGMLTMRELALYPRLAAWRARAHLTNASLPIIAYHFNKPDERVYCEKVLHIRRRNLLFVGIVRHLKRGPMKVVYRINNVVDPEDAADRIMEEVVDRLDLDPALLLGSATPSPTPLAVPSTQPLSVSSPTPFGSPSPASGPESHPAASGVSVVRLVIVDFRGVPLDRFDTNEKGVYVNVFLHNDSPDRAQRHLISVRCLDATGIAYGRTMGGAFTVARGESLDGIDVVERSDPEHHNGWLIHGNLLARHPGTYTITVEIDGVSVAHQEFKIVAKPVRP